MKNKNLRIVTLSLTFLAGWSRLSVASPPEGFLMCSPGTEIFGESFEEGTVSDRWGIRAYFSVEDGVLKRTGHEPEESARVFLKEAAFHNVIFRFDFMFNGAADLRLVTGGGGGYNTITQISPKYFQVNTARRKQEFMPSRQGECAFNFEQGKWHTMTVEFHGEEVVAHVDDQNFVLGSHPIIDTERTYLAFQVQGGSASVDNFHVWKSKPRADWNARRTGLAAIQASRPPAVERDAIAQSKLLTLQLVDRLGRTDPKYRALVASHEALKAELKADYPRAFQTHKELGKTIAAKKAHLKKEDPEFKEMGNAVNKARKAEKNFIHSRFPDLNDMPKHRYYAQFERRQKAMAKDPELLRLKALTAKLQNDHEAKYPEVFASVDALVEERNKHVASLKRDEGFRKRKKEIADAHHAINDYLFALEPELMRLASRIQAEKKAR